MELIYNALDPDVAAYLKANKPQPKHKQNYHQWFTQDYGLKQLIPHIYKVLVVAKNCNNIQELRENLEEYYGKESVQLKLNFPKSKSE